MSNTLFIGWNPELVFLTVVFFYSTDLAVVIPNSIVKRYLFYNTTSWKPTRDSFHPLF